mgnify:CR=1 FL=1
MSPADLAAARREAEEALVAWTTCSRQHEDACFCGAWPMEEALRSLLAASEPAPGHDRIRELETLLRECNAVCMCGCPDADHEADECGESCGHDDHECIRVAPAVLAYINKLRRPAPALPEEAEAIIRSVAEHDCRCGLWIENVYCDPCRARASLASRGGR